MRPFVALLLIAGLSVLSSASPAHADDLGRPTTTEAKQHLTTGNRLYRLREFEKAIEEYKAGAMKEDSPLFAYNLAQCYRQLGRYEEAIWHYERFLGRARPPREMKDGIDGFLKQMKEELAKRPKPEPPPAPAETKAPPPAVVQPTASVQPPAPQPEAVARPRQRLPWILMGAGALAVIAGGVVYALDEDRNVTTPEATYRETARYGVAIGAAGVASLSVGAWLWWRGSSSAPTVAVGRSSAMLGWTGSF